MRLIDADKLKEEFEKIYPLATNEMGGLVNSRIYGIIDNAPTVEIPVARWDAYCEGQKVGYEKALSERPQGEWFDYIEKNKIVKARHGDYVFYKVDFLLDNLTKEVYIMEGARRMRGEEK